MSCTALPKGCKPSFPVPHEQWGSGVTCSPRQAPPRVPLEAAHACAPTPSHASGTAPVPHRVSAAPPAHAARTPAEQPPPALRRPCRRRRRGSAQRRQRVPRLALKRVILRIACIRTGERVQRVRRCLPPLQVNHTAPAHAEAATVSAVYTCERTAVTAALRLLRHFSAQLLESPLRPP